MENLPPLLQISSNTNSISIIGTSCAIWGGGGINPIDGELLPYGILSGGKEIHGGGGIPRDTGSHFVKKKLRIK